jgi:MFS family permease
VNRAGVEHVDAVRRNTVRLVAAQGLVQATFPVLLVIGSVEVADLSGQDRSIGYLNALYFLSAAAGALLIGRWMDRAGRRPGLVLGYVLLASAGVLGMVGVRAGSYPMLLACAVPFGAGLGGANLARGAVADMYHPDRRGKAVGILLAAGTVGAVASPFLIALLQEVAADRGADPNVLPWIIVPAGAIAALACVIGVRPDPRDLAISQTMGSEEATDDRRPKELLGLQGFRTAIVAAAIGQMAMVGLMGVTPRELDHHHASATVVSSVISFHILGMFAFSPLIGAALDRYGRRPGLLAGCCASIVGALLAATDANPTVVGVGLFAIGLGWSATYLGATALISDLTTPTERGGALGFTDLLVSLSSAFAGLAGAFVFEGAGFGVLGLLVAGAVLAVALSVARLRPAPEAERT